jgi:hypothetical protein
LPILLNQSLDDFFSGILRGGSQINTFVKAGYCSCSAIQAFSGAAFAERGATGSLDAGGPDPL